MTPEEKAEWKAAREDFPDLVRRYRLVVIASRTVIVLALILVALFLAQMAVPESYALWQAHRVATWLTLGAFLGYLLARIELNSAMISRIIQLSTREDAGSR
jgi:hypothetical protein